MAQAVSAYATRNAKLGVDVIGAEIPLELSQMMHAAAAKAGVKLSTWVRESWANAVNASLLTHEVDGVNVAWLFDLDLLDPKLAAERRAAAAKAETARKAAELAAALEELEELRAFKASLTAQQAA